MAKICYDALFMLYRVMPKQSQSHLADSEAADHSCCHADVLKSPSAGGEAADKQQQEARQSLCCHAGI